MMVTIIVIDTMQDRPGARTMKNKALLDAMQDPQGATIGKMPMLQASMAIKKSLMETMVKHIKAIVMKLNMVTTVMTNKANNMLHKAIKMLHKAIVVKLHKVFILKLHKATTGAMMSLAMSMKSSNKNKPTATTAMMQMDHNLMVLNAMMQMDRNLMVRNTMMPMDLNPMVIAPTPLMTTGNIMASINQGKELQMAMPTFQDTTMMKMEIESPLEGATNMCNHTIVTANQ